MATDQGTELQQIANSLKVIRIHGIYQQND